MKIYFDGASKGNPGKSGCGWYIEQDLKLVAKGCKGLGIATNNQAEYYGLINALTMAIELKLTNINVYGDSKLVIEQMKGNWKVKAPGLIPLWEKANELAKKFVTINFFWIARSYNTTADSLANQAISDGYA